MPPTTPRPGSSIRRRVIWAIWIAALALGALVFLRLGSFLVDEDPLQKSDVILVLAGSAMERPMEALDVYRQGYAPLILMTQERPDLAEALLEDRGVRMPDEAETARDAMQQLGIPAEAILIPPKRHRNTADEADTLRVLSQQRGWRRAIVVTSKYHTRRAGFAMRRALAGTGVEVVMRASRYDRSVPERWWQQRGDLTGVPVEAHKLLAYVLGLGM
jgi:uncharacterized SAM-binding protein YcdF (DUF218 family)